MSQKRSNIYWNSKIIIALVMIGLSVTKLPAQNAQEIIVTIDTVITIDADTKLVHFNKGEELREQQKFADAIEEYKLVLSSGNSCGKESEAQYCIGICYLWMGQFRESESVFKEVLKTYPNDYEAIAFSNYSLSWLDVQNGNLYEAIERLRKTLDENFYTDEEFCSRAQFQIGRIYLSYLNDHKSAEKEFRVLLDKYPDSEYTNHPFVEHLKDR